MTYPARHATPRSVVDEAPRLSPALHPVAVETEVDVAGALVLTMDSVSRSFGDRRAVDSVSLTVRRGECLGLLGPNGAGKTTTILMVCGLLQPDTGSVTIGPDALPVSVSRARQQIGYVPQEIALYEDLTGRENLRFFGKLYALRGKELAGRVEEVLSFVGLEPRGDDRVGAYSGGMKRRLNIAAALMHRPSLVVLDEPTVGVDPQSRNSILEGLQRLRDEGVALLYTSHYMEEVERICNRIAIMDEGQVLAEGTRETLIDKVGDHVDTVRLRCLNVRPEALAALAAIDEVVSAQPVPEGVELAVLGAAHALPGVLSTAASSGMDVTGVAVEQPDLESVFLHLTGRALRDA